MLAQVGIRACVRACIVAAAAAAAVVVVAAAAPVAVAASTISYRCDIDVVVFVWCGMHPLHLQTPNVKR